VDVFEAITRVTVVRAVRVKAPRPGSRTGDGAAAGGGRGEGGIGRDGRCVFGPTNPPSLMGPHPCKGQLGLFAKEFIPSRFQNLSEMCAWKPFRRM